MLHFCSINLAPPGFKSSVRTLNVLNLHLRLALQPQTPEITVEVYNGQCLSQAKRYRQASSDSNHRVPEQDVLVTRACLQAELVDPQQFSNLGSDGRVHVDSTFTSTCQIVPPG